MKPHTELPKVGRIIRIPADTRQGYARASVSHCYNPFCTCIVDHRLAVLLPGERIADRSAMGFDVFTIHHSSTWEYDT